MEVKHSLLSDIYRLKNLLQQKQEVEEYDPELPSSFLGESCTKEYSDQAYKILYDFKFHSHIVIDAMLKHAKSREHICHHFSKTFPNWPPKQIEARVKELLMILMKYGTVEWNHGYVLSQNYLSLI